MSKFADLQTRILSAIVLIAVAGAALWAGGLAFLALVTLVAGLMMWELTRMLAPAIAPMKAALVGVIAATATVRLGFDASIIALTGLLLAPVLGMVLLEKDRGLFVVCGTAIMFAVTGLLWLRTGLGLNWTIWLILVVIGSDVGGYFFGRILGGPKIFPKISPKKTWSGTLGGWVLAACVGFGMMEATAAGLMLIPLSVLASMAGQAGDMVESAIKRHAGVKDASNLIPGHGGFLDRFDALIGAALLVVVLWSTVGLPGV